MAADAKFKVTLENILEEVRDRRRGGRGGRWDRVALAWERYAGTGKGYAQVGGLSCTEARWSVLVDRSRYGFSLGWNLDV